MPIVGHQIYRLWAQGNVIAPMTVNFAPATIVAQASLHHIDEGGTQKVGIISYRFRPMPDGAETEVPFGPAASFWPSTVSSQRMTSVTFGVWSLTDQEWEGIANIFWWS